MGLCVKATVCLLQSKSDSLPAGRGVLKTMSKMVWNRNYEREMVRRKRYTEADIWTQTSDSYLKQKITTVTYENQEILAANSVASIPAFRV